MSTIAHPVEDATMNRTMVLIALAALPAACGDPAAPKVWDRIEIASPAFEADTVDAIVSQPVVVTIRIPDGRPVLGEAVTYVVVASVGSAALDTISLPISYCATDRSCAGGITSVRWSPTGQWIAYAMKSKELGGGGPLRRFGSLVLLVRPDGSETRFIGPPGSEPHHHGFSGDVNWSPDGEWLIGPSFGETRIRLVQLASGEEVLLNSSVGDVVSSAWTSH
jgi:hypothetical protein